MMIALILVIAACLSLAFMLWLAKGRSSAIRGIEELPGRLRPVDIEAFRNLVDPEQTNFLWATLSRENFRKLQRERLLTAVEYISTAASNASVLIRMGEAARRSPEPAIAEAGEKLVNSAIRLRVYSFQAIVKLYLGMILPGSQLSTSNLAESYERLTGLVFLIGRLQRSAPRATAA
jgi:hypothetical protein